MKKPLVSLIIVNYNGLNWLKKCLPSIREQEYENLEVLIVDNNSSDTSRKFIRQFFPEFKIIHNSSNLGFAEGNNVGVKSAKGDFYFLLNNDTVLSDTGLIQKVIKFMNKNTKIGSVQPKICLMNEPDKIDLCGSFWTPTTMLYHYGFYQNAYDSLYAKSFPVFTCKGAAMIIRKDCVEKVGLFDPDFWCYYEETDFCHRAWLAGYESWYFAEATVLHFNGGTSTNFNNSFIQYHNFKNKLRSFIKNFSGLERISILIRFTIMVTIFVFVSLCLGRTGNIKAIISAYIWNIKKALHHSKFLNKNLSNLQIPGYVIKKPSFLYYIDLMLNLKNHNYDKTVKSTDFVS